MVVIQQEVANKFDEMVRLRNVMGGYGRGCGLAGVFRRRGFPP